MEFHPQLALDNDLDDMIYIGPEQSEINRFA